MKQSTKYQHKINWANLNQTDLLIRLEEFVTSIAPASHLHAGQPIPPDFLFAHADTDLATAYGRAAFKKSIYSDESLAVMRHAFDSAAAAGQLLDGHLWLKRAAISDFLDSVCLNAKREYWLPALGASRSIIELIGMVVLANNETLAEEATFRERVEKASRGNKAKDNKAFSSLFVDDAEKAYNEGRNVISDLSPFYLGNTVSIIQARRLGQRRLDYNHYLNNSLKTNKEKHVKTKQNFVNLTAQDLMLGIEALNKQCKGARRVYDFTSEFTHPNALALSLYMTEVGTVPNHPDRALVTKVEWSTKPRNQFTSLYFGKHLEERFNEVLEVVGGCLDAYLAAEKQLEQTMKKITVAVKKVIRRENRLLEKEFGLPALKKSDLCPCYSGQIFGACCGR